MTFPFPFIPPYKAATATFVAATADPSSSTNYTFASQALTAVMLVFISRVGSATQGVSSVTVGGVAASLVKAQLNADSEVYVSVWYVSGVTPGTGSIVVNGSVASNACTIATWQLVNSAAAATDTDGASFSSGGADPSVAIDVPTAGLVVAGVVSVNQAITFSWTGVTEKFDAQADATGPVHHSGASDNFSSSASGRTVSVARSSTTNKGAMVVVSYAPS